MHSNLFNGQHHGTMLQKIGMWAFVRYCRNNGVSMETCYFLCFGKMPTRMYDRRK
jgi:hypothetical protein